MKKAILLDFDNTILRTQKGIGYAFDAMMLEAFGRELCDDDYSFFQYNTWKNFFPYLADKYGGDGEELNRIYMRRKIEYFERNGVDVADGFHDVMKLPLKKAIVTGISRADIEMFSHIVDFSVFDTIVTDDDVIKGKPNPDPYLLALSRLGLQPHEAAAVEDSRMGITSAKGAGLFTYFSRQFADEDHTAIADKTVENLKAVFDFGGFFID